MAKKSKTQRAKASAARAAKKAQAREAEAAAVEKKDVAQAEAEADASKGGKLLGRFKKADKAEEAAPAVKKQEQPKKAAKATKTDKPEKKRRFAFLKDVRAEMKRVTWPTKKDVLRWSAVVVVALVFFGVYVALLDNVIITPVLVGISGLSGLLG